MAVIQPPLLLQPSDKQLVDLGFFLTSPQLQEMRILKHAAMEAFWFSHCSKVMVCCTETVVSSFRFR